MKILLIQSYYGEKSIPTFPLGLAYLSSVLDSHHVVCFDPNVEENYLDKLKAIIKRFAPDIIGISLRNIWSYDVGLYYRDALLPILGLIKFCGDYPIVIGGAGFTAYASEIMEEVSSLDYGVFGEGEETFSQLLMHLDHPGKVKGLFFRKNGRVYFTGNRRLRDFDSLPSPKWDMFKISVYEGFSAGIGVQTKRGCALSCAYCVYPLISGYGLSMRSPEKIVDEVEALVNKHHVREIIFADSVFNIPVKHAERICRELLKRDLNIRWTAWFCLKHLNEDFMKLAIESGCYLFELSPDAYSDKPLGLLSKNIETSDILKTYRLVKRVKGANVHYNFFFNGPGENILTFLRLALFFLRAKLFLGQRLKQFVISRVHIEPRTELYRLALNRGVIDDQTTFLGPDEDYEKMLYCHSKAVEMIFQSLVIIKKPFKVIKRLMNQRKKNDKDRELLYSKS